MATPLNEKFCLKGGRKNFTVNFRVNSEDRAAYFGTKKLNEKIVADIRQRYIMGNQPKKYLWGQYGCGKTHTLFNIKYALEENPDSNSDPRYRVRCRLIDAEFKEKTNYNYLHLQMMEALTLEAVKEAVELYIATNAGPSLEDKLREYFGDSNTARAMRALVYSGDPVTLWKWLCGGQLSSAELNSYSLTKNMDTVSELYRVLIGIGRLFAEKETYYLFLFDEMEGLRNVRNRDSLESFHDAFRKLADDDNSVIGFIVSIHAMKEDDIPEFMYTEDIKTRLNLANIHQLEYYNDADDVKQFLKDLFKLVVDEEKKAAKEQAGVIPHGMQHYPLSEDALDELVHLATSAPTASLPRNFLSALNEAAVHAAGRDSHTIEAQDLESAELIFREPGM